MKKRWDTMNLNCVDRGMFALHTKNEAMLIHWVLTISGTVDPVRLRSVLIAVAANHPGLRSTIRSGLLSHRKQIRDMSAQDPLTVSDLGGPDTRSTSDSRPASMLFQERLSQWINRSLDPANELPWRILLLGKSRTESSLVFTFHHSATDGFGALHFIAEVIEKYANVTDQRVLPAGQTAHSSSDELIALAQATRRGVNHFYIRMLTDLCYRFFIAPHAPNARICRAASRPAPGVYFCQGALNPYELRQIRSRAKESGVTVNDVLLAAGFSAFEKWNAVHGKQTQKISIMVPVDLGRVASSSVEGNRVSFISVSTKRHERANQKDLLRTVHQRTSCMLRNGTAYSIVYAVYFCCLFSTHVAKAVARFLLATRVYLDSILITNLGVISPRRSAPAEVYEMGDATITSMVVMPPVVSPMGMSLSACTYHGNLHVTLAYKTSHFSHAEAQLFLNLFLHEMRSYQRTAQGVLAPSVTEWVTRATAPATSRW